MEVQRYDNGVPSWVDMGSADLPRAKEFYRGLFGWNTPEGPPKPAGMRCVTSAGRPWPDWGPNMNPSAPPHWSTYVNVDSADETIAKVEANGGTVYVAPMDVMEAGGWLSSLTRRCGDRPVAAASSTWGPNWSTSRARTAGASS
jgi:predicted enzyme related to lactoylglutathione lyase